MRSVVVILFADLSVAMPTKRLPKLGIDTQRTETKENISSALLLNKERMTRKRSRSDPGEPTNVTTVLRLSQEANNLATDDHVDSKEDAEVKDSNESNNRHVSSARLYAQSLQKANARKLGNSKRIKISSVNNSVLDQLLSQGGKVVTTSFSEQSIISHGLKMSPASTDVTVSDVELRALILMKTKIIIIRLMLLAHTKHTVGSVVTPLAELERNPLNGGTLRPIGSQVVTAYSYFTVQYSPFDCLR